MALAYKNESTRKTNSELLEATGFSKDRLRPSEREKMNSPHSPHFLVFHGALIVLSLLEFGCLGIAYKSSSQSVLFRPQALASPKSLLKVIILQSHSKPTAAKTLELGAQ